MLTEAGGLERAAAQGHGDGVADLVGRAQQQRAARVHNQAAIGHCGHPSHLAQLQRAAAHGRIAIGARAPVGVRAGSAQHQYSRPRLAQAAAVGQDAREGGNAVADSEDGCSPGVGAEVHGAGEG